MNKSLSIVFASHKQWIIIVASLLLILFFFQKTLNPLLKDRNNILSQSFFVHELQYSILKTISNNPLKNKQSFDTLNHQIQLLKKTLHSLKNNQAIQAIPKLSKKLNHLMDTANQQQNLIEQFKTNYSVLQNSLYFYPTAFNICTQPITQSQQPNTKPLQERLKNTFISGLLSVHNADIKQRAQLNKHIEILESQQNLSTQCQIFLAHSRLLSEYSPKIRNVNSQLANLKIDDKVHDFYTQLEISASKVMAKNQTYYLIIVMFTIFLLIYIGMILTNLFRSNQHLKETLDTLSQKQALFESLLKASTAITQSKNRSNLYQNICDAATQKSLFESCWIGEITPQKTLVSVACSGEGKSLMKKLVIPLDSNAIEHSGTILECYQTKKPVITNHYPKRMAQTSWATLIQKLGIQGNASIPILMNNQVVAVLIVYTRKSNVLTNEYCAFLEQLASDISITLERFSAIDAQEKHQQNLAISSIAFESHEAILITDDNANIIRSNKAFTTLTGYSQQEVLGKTPSILKSEFHTESFYKSLWQSLYKTGVWQGEMWNRKKDGTFYPCQQSISSVLDSTGKVTHYISHALDLTKDKQAQREINRLSWLDKLTNLPNRSLLIDRLTQSLSQSGQNYHCLYLININRFKLFNESLGHSAGDALLIKIAQQLQSLNIKHVDNLEIARIGNDEFSISCITKIKNTNKAHQQAEIIANDIQAWLGKPFVIQKQTAMIDTSIGVTLFTPGNKTAETLLQEANMALDNAKKLAKQTAQSTIQFYKQAIHEQSQDRLKLENQLRTALTNQEFTLQYQPQINLITGNIIGVETLIRWQQKDGNLVPPNAFIPALEESGLIIPVGIWIIEEAIIQAKILHKIRPDITLSVNLSAIQFNDKHLIENVKKILQKRNYPANLLEFEVTESLLMSDIEEAIKKLNAFANLGIKIAIDDFGTGYSSLAYLKRFPVSKLKIDKAFIDEITHTDSSDSAIVLATIQMTKTLKITTIAEGVEEQSQLNLLKTMGCDEIQGYLVSKPLSPDDLTNFIQAHQA
ncbi:MAG: EAL domain-containing protein [Thiomicrorhabdus sp.]|nr:EAL domain-containing protein [Thiomicrorhabdus sp.]